MNLNKKFTGNNMDKFDIFANIGFVMLLISFILPGGNIGNIELWKFIDVYILCITLIYIYKKSNINNIKGIFRKFICLLWPFRNISDKFDKYFLIYIYTYVYIIFGDGIFSFFNNNELKMIFQQSYTMLTIALKITFIFFYLKDNRVKNEKFNVLNLLYFFMIIKVIFKISFAFYAFSKGLEYNELMNVYNNLFGGIIMSQPISELGFLRIDTANDVLPFYIFLFYLYDNNFSNIKKIITSIFMFIYILIIYSRIFIAFYVFSLIIILFHKLIIKLKYKNIKFIINKRVAIIAMMIFILLCGSGYLLTKTSVYKEVKGLIVERFVGDATKYSDDIRLNQKKAIMNEIENSIVIGKGIGSYADELIRSEINKYSYELEYLAFIMQFGVIGFILLIIGMFMFIFIILYQYINNKNKVLIIPILLCTIFQIGKMTTNPFFDKIIVLFLVSLAFLINSDRIIERKKMIFS